MNNNFNPLSEPIPIKDQKWPKDTLPLVHTRTMSFMHEKYIQDCIEGIINQKTTFPVQVLIHDDASTDRTPEIIRHYESKYPELIKAYYQSENTYSKKNKNELRTEFKSWRIGKYEAICEGDDYWIDSEKLQKQVEYLENNTEYGLVFTDADHLIEESGKVIRNYDRTHNRKIPVGDVLNVLLYANPYKTCTSMFKTEYIKGYYNSVIGRSRFTMGDIGLWLYIAQQSKIAYIPHSTAIYRIRKESASHSDDIEKVEKFAQKRNDMSILFANQNGLEIDKKRLTRSYTNAMIKYCIVNNRFKSLLKYYNNPFLIAKIYAKEKIIRPLIIGRSI